MPQIGELIECGACSGLGTIPDEGSAGLRGARIECGYCKGSGKVPYRPLPRKSTARNVSGATGRTSAKGKERTNPATPLPITRALYSMLLDDRGWLVIKVSSEEGAMLALEVAKGLSELPRTSHCLHGSPPYWDDWCSMFDQSEQHRIWSLRYSAVHPHSIRGMIELSSMTEALPMALFQAAAAFMLSKRGRSERL